ncbi:MAG: RNA-directed DNA polymerase [Lachnospiraceae bacterium]|nr:RNA-directed DNA polymerase [Lachnospiraceae bacterium]
MKLQETSIRWALIHIKKEKDTDLFPTLKEYEILLENEEYLVNRLKEIEIEEYNWQQYRRFIIPKDEYSYRVAIQLDPIDNILIVALIYQYGNKIEEKRVPIEEKKVFNYRFKPTSEGNMYDRKEAWKNFWITSKEKMNQYTFAVYIDIADFYNRIYHHTLENQLIDCGFENQIIKSIRRMLQNTTQTVSQGIPIGPHAMHLFAEMCLIPLDENLLMKGYDYCRYSDDIIVFVNSESEGQIVIYELAKVLDSLKLNMQRHKTKIYTKEDFLQKCNDMLKDNPISELEEEMIKIINTYSSDPYAIIGIDNINEVDKEVFSEERIENILMSYLTENKDYQRIRWLFRRLSNVGVDTAINVTIREIDNLMPAISDIALYFSSIAQESNIVLENIGEKLLGMLKNPIIRSNEFLQITILNLFAKTDKFNHIARLVEMYNNSSDYIKREIILAAYSAKQKSWIRELKQDYNGLGAWGQRALLIASELLPKDERRFFLQNVTQNTSGLSSEIIAKIVKDK